MKQTALYDALQGHGDVAASMPQAEYRGAVTAANFSDADKEFQALQSGCGVYDLGFRAKISLAGNDRVRWLNGMVSNKIKDLPAGQGIYAFILNPQGHILGDLYTYNRGESLVVDTDQSQLDRILAIFKRYIIMDKVEVKDLGGELTALGVAGPKSRGVLRAAGIEVPEMAPLQVITPRCDCACDCLECMLVRSDAPEESYEIWISPGTVKQAWDALVAAGATPAGSEAVEKNRIISGVPLYGVDIRERELPQETEQMRALNFQKGCYIGQEIVERIRSRGSVHRKFTGFVCEDAAQIAAGDKVVVADKEIGEITSVTSVHEPETTRTVALGYIRREIGSPGREVAIGAYTAVVTEMPFVSRHAEYAAVPQ
ncbi:MAG TPA: glycine cleavage T C-terminal barrel domain-containing protein [Candidatus Sulfotelmatobacter sp.]